MNSLVILGTGPSIHHYKASNHKGAFVVGINDAYNMTNERVDAVCCADQFKYFPMRNPRVLDIPQSVPFWVIDRSWIGKRENVELFHTRRFNSVHVNDKGIISRGFTSVHTASFIGIHKGATTIHVYGVDQNEHVALYTPIAKQRTVSQFVAIDKHLNGGLFFTKHSQLYEQYESNRHSAKA